MRRQNRTRTYQNYRKYIYAGIFLLIVGLITFSASVNMYSGIVKEDDTNKNLAYSTSEETTQTTTMNSKSVEEKEAEERQAQNVEKIKEQEEALKQATSDEEKSNTNTAIKTNTSENQENKNQQSNNQEEVTNDEKTTEQQDPIFIMPVFGEISREFAKDNLVYSETLDEWITHLGMDILAEKSASVRASAEGTVKSIKNDPRYGLTVIIEHSNGFKSVYANLEDVGDIKEGSVVKQGQAIGSVGNSASFESLDACHLHFEILKDDIAQNPSDYIK